MTNYNYNYFKNPKTDVIFGYTRQLNKSDSEKVRRDSTVGSVLNWAMVQFWVTAFYLLKMKSFA